MFDFLFIIGIVLLGLVTSFTDYKFGLIRNKVLKIALVYAVLVNILIFFTLKDINSKAYSHYFINAGFMLLVSYILWVVGLWTAGDAKLFFIFNLLTPPSLMGVGYMGVFYGFTFFVNIFSILLIYLLYKIIRKISWFEFKYSLKKAFDRKTILIIILFMFSIGFLNPYLPVFLRSNFFTMMFCFFIVFILLQKIFGKYILMIFVLLAIIRIFVENKNLLELRFWIDFFKQILFFFLLRFVLLRLSYFAFTKKVRINDLKQKMFLAEDIIPVQVSDSSVIHYKKKMIENLTFFAYLQKLNFKLFSYNMNIGLTKKNLNWIIKNREHFLFNKIRVYETMPFAPMISLGVLLSVLVNGNIFIFIVKFFLGLF